jgi:5-methyltetrahydropteroyltriglutamate--homocysteine methyltransferase
MEFNSSSAKKLQSLKDFPKDKLLGLGVMQPKAAEIDVPDTVVQRARVAMEFVEKERLILNPDCGFATTVTNPGNLDRAYLKLSSLCTGAQMLRNDYV